MTRRSRRRGALAAGLLACALAASPLAVAQEDEGQGEKADEAALPVDNWVLFLDALRDIAARSPAMVAESARVDARRAARGAESSDLGLTLSGSYTSFPDGGGSENSGSFTNLEEYAEARLSLDLMDLFARRASRVDSADARVEQAKYEREVASQQAAATLMEDAVTAWSYQFRRDALQKAMNSVEEAKRKLRLSESAGLPEITKATPTNVAEALILHARIKSDLEAISPFIPTTPEVPPDFSVLPQQAPNGDDIVRLSNEDPEAKSLRAASEAYEEEAESLNLNGVELSVYGGYVAQSLRETSQTDTGPQYGVTLEIPLGARQHKERKAAEYQAHAAKLDARAAIHQRQRLLLQLRDHWAESVAQLNNAQENMRQQSRVLEKMRRRAASPQSGRAPEPWEVDLQAARFWSAVADVWERRATWLQDVLTWGLLEPDYLKANARESKPAAIDSLCAPLRSCDV